MDHMWPDLLVSIQIPTYNQETFIGRAIESTLAQDYPFLEIVVADDCSNDKTKEVVEKYKCSRLKYFRNNENVGRVANYRKALYEYCKGDWVVNLDADDYYTDPQFISRSIRRIQEIKITENRVVMYAASFRMVKGEAINSKVVFTSKHKILRGKEWGWVGIELFKNAFKDKFFIPHMSTLYNRQSALEVGFYEYNSLITDIESFYKLSLHGITVLDNNVAGCWQMHSENASAKFVNEIDKIRNSYYRVATYSAKYVGIQESNKWLYRANREVDMVIYVDLATNGKFVELGKRVLKSKKISFKIIRLLIIAFLRKHK